MKRLLFVLALLISVAASADDAYVVNFSARGATSICHQASWVSDTVVFNTTAAPITVRLIGVSNGTLRSGTPLTTVVPASQAFSLRLNGPSSWVPFTSSPNEVGTVPPLYVLHLDLPHGVVAESMDTVTDIDICGQPGLGQSGAEVKVSMPIFRALTAANEPQVKVGTDVGSTPARLNVAIYNGGDRTANATIEVRRGCDDTIVDSRSVTVDANTITQFGALSTGNSSSCTAIHTFNDVRYTVVTVDQPSITFVTAVTENQPKSTDNIIPLVELAVSISSVF